MAADANPNPTASASALRGFFDGDVWHSFRSSPVAMGAAVIALVFFVCALFAEAIAPHNPFDLATLELMDSLKPPAWIDGGERKYLLGTDGQGRDILSALMYGTRISLLVGVASVLLSIVIGVGLGLLAGFVGGRVDAFIMRLCDVMLSFPSILVALMISGVGRSLFPNAPDALAFVVLVLAISLTGWVQYARTVRGSTLVERNKEYVQAASVIGVGSLRIMRRHVLPNVVSPIIVATTLSVGNVILMESVLSFLGLGIQPPLPSWGNMLTNAQELIWQAPALAIYPGLLIFVTVIAFNFLGDGLQDALDPRAEGP